MAMTPEDIYNQTQISKGEITGDDITRMMEIVQPYLGVMPDGFCGPVTLEALRRLQPPAIKQSALVAVSEHRVVAASPASGVSAMNIHPSWYGANVPITPKGIVWHYSVTGPGSAKTMAKNRQVQFDKTKHRLSSWHITIDEMETITMLPMNRAAWHAGSTTAKPIPGLGWANYNTVGIELVSMDGSSFSPYQIDLAREIMRALAVTYSIPREYALISHQSIDPERRNDPGPLWMNEIGPRLLEDVYGK